MSSITKQIYFNNFENKVRKDPNFNTNDEIKLFLTRWLNGLSFIDGIIDNIQNQNYKINVIFSNVTQDNSLSTVEKNASNVFANNPIMKNFIIKYASAFRWKWTNNEYPVSIFDGHINGNKLILYSFSQIPTGNKLFSKYLYIINYYELELTK